MKPVVSESPETCMIPRGYVPIDDDFDMSVKRRHGPGRASWKNKIQLFLAFIGYSMGLPNVWRFPYLCYDNGGGAFLIPYIIMLLICGFPLLYLELAIGQLAQAGPIIAICKFSPLFKGLGVVIVIVAFVVGFYNIIIVTWSLFYVFKSFGNTLPWSTCKNKWNTRNCYSLNNSINASKYDKLNMTIPSTQEFFENRVLVVKNATDDKYKYVQWELAILLFLAWIIVFFGIRRGVKSIGKAFYLTATVPFIVVIIMLVKSVKLPGASLGLNYLMKPDLSKLLVPEIWILGATQSFYSLGIAFGSIIALASYNDENNNIFRDGIVMTITSTLISVIVMITTFSIIGHIAHINHHNIEEAITQGPGLVFVVYPQVFSTLPYTQVWAFLYFLMLICLGLDRQFAIVEVVVTSFHDVKLLDKYLPCRQALVLITCVVSYLIGLIFLTRNGILYLHLIDYYVVGISFLHIAFFEVLMVVVFFGVNNFCDLLYAFTRTKPSIYFVICWRTSPFIIITIMFFHLAKNKPIRYDDIYNYPKWAIGIGWFLAYLPIITVILGFLLRIRPLNGRTCRQRFRNCFDSVMSLEALSLRYYQDSPPQPASAHESSNNDDCDDYKVPNNQNNLPLLSDGKIPDLFYKYRPLIYRYIFDPMMDKYEYLSSLKRLSNQLAYTKMYFYPFHHLYHEGRQRLSNCNGPDTYATSSDPSKGNQIYVDPEEFVLRFMPDVKAMLDEEKLVANKNATTPHNNNTPNGKYSISLKQNSKKRFYNEPNRSVRINHASGLKKYYSISNAIFLIHLDDEIYKNLIHTKPQYPSKTSINKDEYVHILTKDNVHVN